MEDVKRCPRCHSEDVVPIVYGLPGPELTEEAMAGRAALGGCMVWPGAPEHTCQNCGHDWRDEEVGS